jgi:hypothetical protein
MFAQIPLVVSYYTKNTPYEEEAKHLQSSCEKFSIEHQIDAVPDLGSWVKNCAFKSHFLQEKMEKVQRPLLWVDADAVFVNKLSFEEFMFAPFAIMLYEGVQDPAFAVHAGTLYINATKEGVQALHLWNRYCENLVQQTGTVPPFLDQIGLFLLSKNKSISVATLPQRYCQVFDRPCQEPEKIVIEQRQASRRLNSGEKISISINTKNS